jgi:hypothetical protein
MYLIIGKINPDLRAGITGQFAACGRRARLMPKKINPVSYIDKLPSDIFF